jgi:hypothetical protein
MNDDTELSAEQLLQATSRRLPSGANLDGQTAALRAGFLQLGAAVEEANSKLDKPRLIAELSRRGEADRGEADREERRFGPLALSAALAVGALVAIGLIVAVWPSPDHAVNVPVQPGERTSPSLASWVDPLDDEIASALQAVKSLGGPAAGPDGSLESVGWRLEALSAELERGSL